VKATHVLNRVLSAVLAVALVALAVLVVIEVVLAWLGRPSLLVSRATWGRWFTDHTWDDSKVVAILIGVTLVGLVLLVLGLRRGKPRVVTLPSKTPGVEVSASRRSLERAVASAASRTPAVADASASATNRSVKVTVRPGTRHTDTLQDEVKAAVDGRLSELGLERMSSRVKMKGAARL
jgi:Family of unknown function (DUF6286)